MTAQSHSISDPAQAARDLRRSAEVIAERGHGTEELINLTDGRVCLMGAIGIATDTVRAVQREYDWIDDGVGWVLQPTFPSLSSDGDLLMSTINDAPPRVRDCAIAINRLLPSEIRIPTPSGVDPEYVVPETEDPVTRCWTYNDAQCDGGEAAIALVIEAAEKLEADL